MFTVRFVKTTDASHHCAACASALVIEMSCCTSVVVRLWSKLQMPPVAPVFSFQRNLYKDKCLGSMPVFPFLRLEAYQSKQIVFSYYVINWTLFSLLCTYWPDLINWSGQSELARILFPFSIHPYFFLTKNAFLFPFLMETLISFSLLSLPFFLFFFVVIHHSVMHFQATGHSPTHLNPV